MNKSGYDLVNRNTGEIIESVPVWVGGKPVHSIYGNRWFMASQDAWDELSKNERLVGRPTQVLIYLLGKLDFENWIYLQQTDISKDLKLQKTHVSKYIGLLCKEKILLKGPKIGNGYGYRLNPNFGWKGSNKKAREYQLELINGGKANKMSS